MSESTIQKNKRIAKNTFFLYVRMLIIMAISLYTSRVVLNMLGVEDFGLYNVIGGVVSFLAFLNSSMSVSVQRFLSFEMGQNGSERKIAKIFSMSLNIHLLIALLVFVILETVGLWFIKNEMNIAPDRMDAAIFVFHFSVLACCVNFVRVPYMALIIAYEKMEIYAYVSIVEAILKLLLVYLLVLGDFDRMSFYSVLTFIATCILTLIYIICCRAKFKSSKYVYFWDKALFLKLTGFASWSALGELSWVATIQGVNIILNIFFGTIVNAARGISIQVNAAINSFVSNFQTAINPQIIKSYADNDLSTMLSFVYRGTRFSFYLILLVSLPLYFNMDFVLRLWLHIVPDYTSEFCCLVIINILLDTLSNLFATVAKAYGKIRNYQMIVSFLLLLNFPVSYLVLALGASPVSVLYVYSTISVILLFVRILLVQRMLQRKIYWEYFKFVLSPILKVSVLALILPLFFHYTMSDGASTFVLSLLVCCLPTCISIYLLGLQDTEKVMLKQRITFLKKKNLK
jgi:conserved hypothetical transmembrane protein; putative transmembrane protein